MVCNGAIRLFEMKNVQVIVRTIARSTPECSQIVPSVHHTSSTKTKPPSHSLSYKIKLFLLLLIFFLFRCLFFSDLKFFSVVLMRLWDIFLSCNFFLFWFYIVFETVQMVYKEIWSLVLLNFYYQGCLKVDSKSINTINAFDLNFFGFF